MERENGGREKTERMKEKIKPPAPPFSRLLLELLEVGSH